MARVLCFVALLWATATAVGGGTPSGAFGQGIMPSAESVPLHAWHFYGIGFRPTNDSGMVQSSLGLIARPWQHLELGTVHGLQQTDSGWIESRGNLSVKVILPNSEPWGPLVALGSYGLVDDSILLRHIWVAGGVHPKWQTGGLLLEAGTVFHRDVRQVEHFVTGEVQRGPVSLGIQAIRGQAWTIVPSLGIQPSSPFTLQAGAKFEAANARESAEAWASVGVTLATEQWRKPNASGLVRQQTLLYIDVQPFTDHYLLYGKGQSRMGVSTDIALASGIPDLYLVNGIDLIAHGTRQRDSLAPRAPWDRSYMLGAHSDGLDGSLRLALGFLQYQTAGALLQWLPRSRQWPQAQVDIGYTRGAYMEGVISHAKIPLHPKLPGALTHSWLFVDGGLFEDQRPAVAGGIRLGGRNSWLETRVGYESRDKAVVAETKVVLDLYGTSTSKGPTAQNDAQLRMAPRWEYRSDVPVYVWHAGAPIPLQGNSTKRFHTMPWSIPETPWVKPTMGSTATVSSMEPESSTVQAVLPAEPLSSSAPALPLISTPLVPAAPASAETMPPADSQLDSDGDGLADVFDACPNKPEDFDGFLDMDGCSDLDNDGDGIPDSDDRCPMEPETFDGITDGDGCP